jgi:S1-C subfamily serine protease
MKKVLTILLLFTTFISSAQSTNWNEYKLKEHWKENGAEEIEGIYIDNRYVLNCNGFGNCKDDSYTLEQKFYIVKQNNEYTIGTLTNGYNEKLVKMSGYQKYFLNVTPNDFYFLNLEDNDEITLSLYLNNTNELISEKVTFNEKHGSALATITFKDKFSPIYKPEKKEEIVKKQKSSGTGFGISSNGIIVTNYHVIDNATSIKVRGVNSNFNKTYRAKILVSDKNNDLALIQIDDYNFTSLPPIPFTIKTSLTGVGENIFVLGYPLRATMGDEIKLTNGIVSSKSGFQGEINSYQISAPIQPGNSGGPLFDGQGNIIGIINAKHSGAENASYAIKASYLTNLIDLLPTSPKLQTINLLKGKTLSQQVVQVKNFVFIIETE